MKNILFFIESLSGGGAEKVLVTLLKHIDYTKYNVTLMTVSDVGVLKNQIDFSKINYKTLISDSKNLFSDIINRIKYKLIYQYLPARIVNKLCIPQKGFDTYIAFTEGLCTKILAHAPKDKRKISWVHCDLKYLPWTIERGIYKNIEEEQKAYNKYNFVITVSNTVESVMRKEYALENVRTIYNPIDTDSIIECIKEKSIYNSSNEFNIISIGRLVTAKGYDLLIPIVARLIKEGLNINLYILGEGAERENLEKLIVKKNVEKNIHLLGYVSNPYPILNNMNLFVCSSRSEGYSLALAEALVLGVPAVSTNCSGPNELLDGYKYGELCNSYEELESAIRKAATDTIYYNELKEKAAKRKEFFNINNTIKEIEEIL